MPPPASDDVFRALADPSRRAILALLRVRARPVREIAAHFPVSRPAISKHLRQLDRAGLVRVQCRGRERLYSLAPGPLETVREWLDGSPEAPPPNRPRSSHRAPDEEAAGAAAERGRTSDWQVW